MAEVVRLGYTANGDDTVSSALSTIASTNLIGMKNKTLILKIDPSTGSASGMAWGDPMVAEAQGIIFDYMKTCLPNGYPVSQTKKVMVVIFQLDDTGTVINKVECMYENDARVKYPTWF